MYIILDWKSSVVLAVYKGKGDPMECGSYRRIKLLTRCRWHSIGFAAKQAALVWHVLRKDGDDWVKKCMDYEVEGPRPSGRPKRTWKEVVREDCRTRKLNKVDAVDRCKWRKVLKAVRWSGWVSGWVFLLVLAYSGSPGTKAVKRLLLLLF